MRDGELEKRVRDLLKMEGAKLLLRQPEENSALHARLKMIDNLLSVQDLMPERRYRSSEGKSA